MAAEIWGIKWGSISKLFHNRQEYNTQLNYTKSSAFKRKIRIFKQLENNSLQLLKKKITFSRFALSLIAI